MYYLYYKIKRKLIDLVCQKFETVQMENNLYVIACKRLATYLQLACERLAEDEASEDMQTFKRLVSCLQKGCNWLTLLYVYCFLHKARSSQIFCNPCKAFQKPCLASS